MKSVQANKATSTYETQRHEDGYNGVGLLGRSIYWTHSAGS